MKIRNMPPAQRNILIFIGIMGAIAISFLLWAFLTMGRLATSPSQEELSAFAAKSSCHRELVLAEDGVITNFDLKLIDDKCHSRNMQAIIRGSN